MDGSEFEDEPLFPVIFSAGGSLLDQGVAFERSLMQESDVGLGKFIMEARSCDLSLCVAQEIIGKALRPVCCGVVHEAAENVLDNVRCAIGTRRDAPSCTTLI